MIKSGTRKKKRNSGLYNRRRTELNYYIEPLSWDMSIELRTCIWAAPSVTLPMVLPVTATFQQHEATRSENSRQSRLTPRERRKDCNSVEWSELTSIAKSVVRWHAVNVKQCFTANAIKWFFVTVMGREFQRYHRLNQWKYPAVSIFIDVFSILWQDFITLHCTQTQHFSVM